MSILRKKESFASNENFAYTLSIIVQTFFCIPVILNYESLLIFKFTYEQNYTISFKHTKNVKFTWFKNQMYCVLKFSPKIHISNHFLIGNICRIKFPLKKPVFI